MPELTAIHVGLLALMLLAGAVLGWILRSDRCAKEKMSVNASWQDQLESQQSEHNRLAEQNKSLMEQIGQYQASQKDYSNRAKELSGSLKEAFSRRDELQRQIKDIRGNLEVAVTQRDRLQDKHTTGQIAAIKEKDDKIFRLSRELTSWQSRVPPLVERFRERDQQARELEEELTKAQTRLQALEDMVKSDHTRIEPLDADSLPDGGDASNEPNALTSFNDESTLQDQIDGRAEVHDVFGQESIESKTEESSLDDSAFAAVFSSNEDTANIEEVHDEENEGEVSADEVSNEPETLDTTADEVSAACAEAPDEIQVSAEHDVDENTADDGAESSSQKHQPAENGVDDDLKMIKGIGPSIEKTLHGLGIYRFHQIAELSEYEIDRVAQQLRGFRSRIYREDWIGQARDLQHQKTNDRI